MRRRYISALAAVLAAALSVTPLSARAADTQDYEARFERIREQMLSDFESGEYRAPQPYGLPDSYAPPGAWEAAAGLYPNAYAFSQISEDLAELEDVDSSNSTIVGGYQDWGFFNDDKVMQSDGSNFAEVMYPFNVWFFFVCRNGTAVSTLQVSKMTDENGDTKFVLGAVYPGGSREMDSLIQFAEETADETFTGPIMLDYRRGECIVAADTENGGKVFVSHKSELGVIDPAGLIGFEQASIRLQRAWLAEKEAQGEVIAGGGGGLSYMDFTPMAPDPEPAPPEPEQSPWVVIAPVAAGVALITAGTVVVLRRRAHAANR